ncbi:NAD-dependent protein deacetylase sirtuin-3, mitochondrial isoform X6 [Cuculus canorus]|uniref:NAD-dependent protein deacetylase sirtuin-3, mitochondrial isoform X6 n=1 Tax=Cuculus canorus TaxID=55661 RepID=UPI0023AA5D78|nr:NAD-dependent protein deacetylase sirtuin-3, mitochondrial isoform X6 [Cuculus canorus]
MERSAGQRLLAAAWRSLWERGPRPSGCSGVPAIPARLSPCPANRGGMADSRAGSRSQGSRSFSLSATARAVLGMGRWGGDGGKQKLSLRDVAELIRKKECRRVVVMAGAGISTPSGIPDFRSPGSGLYSNLEQYDIPYPEAIFELAYFFSNPKPFFTLAKELYPGNYRPNYAHYFLRLLHEKGLLLRLYTQNIDGLERAGCERPVAELAPSGQRATGTWRRSRCGAQHGPGQGAVEEANSSAAANPHRTGALGRGCSWLILEAESRPAPTRDRRTKGSVPKCQAANWFCTQRFS